MQRIYVDFNTMMSEPVDRVKLAKVGSPNARRLPALHEGERVLLYDEEMEVEGTILFDTTSDYWMAIPDDATWRDLPVPERSAAETA